MSLAASLSHSLTHLAEVERRGTGVAWHREMFSVDILPAQLPKINLCESGLLRIDTYSGEQGRLISNLSLHTLL